jgi:hypothetical protein
MIWSFRLKNKTEAISKIREVLQEVKTLTGKPVKYLRTDGDGIFARSQNFKDLQEKEGFQHERPAPYDHQQSGLIDRECRTMLESISTLLIESGLPSSFWGEAAEHFTFTKNNIPTHRHSKKLFISPYEKLTGKPGLNLKYFVAFGTKTTVFQPKEQRHEHKTPGLQKTFTGLMIGYVKGMRGYRIWDIEHRKVREVSYNFCSFEEGVFPYRKAPRETETAKNFYPTLESFVDPKEWEKFDFTQEEEDEVIRKEGLLHYTEEKEDTNEEKEEIF